ncbi:MAG: hypothetical protein KC503_30785, partial [Myxococcales bacterium]|nr:hypothetical protein [Myxococcales bacterium]
MNKIRAALAALRARGAFDLLWIAGFAVCLTLLLMRPSVSAVTGKGVALELATGAQRRALYSGDTRVATIVERVARDGESWRVTQTLQLPGEDTPMGHIKLQLFKDLSLKRVDIDA